MNGEQKKIAEILSTRGLGAESLPPGADGIEILRVPASGVVRTLQVLADDAEAGFDLLLSVTGTDFKDRIEVLYLLYSSGSDRSVTVKVDLDPVSPRVPSVSGVHPGANYHERETYDLLGVIFEGHPDLRRLLLPYGWKGHPLRKDYVMDDARLTWNSR
jgi:NADH-quinone oxidoreductase subunit C